jgi:hypothetical protein
MQTGGTVVALCFSDSEMEQILPALTTVLSNQPQSSQFAFLVCISGTIRHRPLFENCDVIVESQPLHFGATFEGLEERTKSSQIAMFEASLGIFARTVHNGIHYSFANAIVAANFVIHNPQITTIQIAEFLVNYFYVTEFNIGIKRMIRIFEGSFDCKRICRNFRMDFAAIGFDESASLFKSECLRRWKGEKLERKIVNLGSPERFLNGIQSSFAVEMGRPLRDCNLVLELNRGEKIEGLICIGGELRENRISKCGGIGELPVMMVRGGLASEIRQKKGLELFYNGEYVETLLVDVGEGEDEEKPMDMILQLCDSVRI